MHTHLHHPMNPKALYYTATSSSAFVSEEMLAEDVRFLHSLWHLGPPPDRSRGMYIPPGNEEEESSSSYEHEDSSAESDSESDSESMRERKKQRREKNQEETLDWQTGERRSETLDYPEVDNDDNWNPYPWENEKKSAPAEWTTQKSEGMLLSEEEERQLAQLRLQNRATRACKDFLSKGPDSEDDTEDDDDKDSDCAPSGAHAREVSSQDFFDKLFVRDEELRRFYEQNCNCGSFECLVCAAVGAKAGKKFPDCVSLIQHAMKIMKTKKLAAHRGYGRSICTMLGWNSDRLPSIPKPNSIMVPRGCIPPPDEVKVQGPAEGDNTNKTEAAEGDITNKTESAEEDIESDLEAAVSDNSDTDNVEDEEPASE